MRKNLSQLIIPYRFERAGLHEEEFISTDGPFSGSIGFSTG
jgi:hypothetical protein